MFDSHDNFHEWKIILLPLINKHFGESLDLHPSPSFDATIVENFPKFSKEIFINWQNYLTSIQDFPSCSSSNFLWYIENILINNKTVYIAFLSYISLNYVSQLFDIFGKIKQWNNLKNEFHLCENTCN